MSLPRTTAPLPAISSWFEVPRRAYHDHLSLPRPGTSSNWLIPSLGPPYPSPPMSRRSSVKQNPETTGHESEPASHFATSASAGRTSRSSFSLNQPQQPQNPKDEAAGQVAYKQSPSSTTVSSSSQPSPQRNLISAPLLQASSSTASPRAGSQHSSRSTKPWGLKFLQFQLPPQHSSTSEASGARASRPSRNAKQHVQAACSNCKKAHLSCDEARPCGRCIVKGLEDTCVDVQHKKRGRPRTRPSDFQQVGDTSPTSTLPSPLPRDTQQRSPNVSSAMQHHKSTRTPDTFEPAGSATASVASAAQPVLPTAFLDMDFHIERTNEPFRRLFGFLGKLEDQPLEKLVDPKLTTALRQLRIVLLEERDTRNSPRLPPIRSADAPHVGEIPTIESQDLSMICRGQVPRQETWLFRTAEGGTQSLTIQLCLARTEIFFLTLVVNPGGEQLAKTESPQLSDKTLSPVLGSAPYHQSVFPSQSSQYPRLRRSRRYSRPLSSYIEHPSQAIPSTTVAPSLPSATSAGFSPIAAFSTSSTSVGSMQPLPPSPSTHVHSPQDAGRRRSLGGPSPSSITQNRRRHPPPSWSYQLVEIPDPSFGYAQSYSPNYQAHPSSQLHQAGPLSSFVPSTPYQTRAGQLQLPPLTNTGTIFLPPPPASTAARSSTAGESMQETESAATGPSITSLRRQESKKERSSRRISAREEREREHEAETYELAPPSSYKATQTTSERPPSRKRTIHDS